MISASLALYYFSFIDNSWAPTPDSAYYVSLAESLVHGKGYTFGGQPHVKYPPGLSLLLAPSYLFKKPYLYDHVVMVLSMLGILAAVYVGFRKQIGIFSCLLIVVLIGCSYWFWQFSCVFILSDVPFAAFVLFTCLAGRAFLNADSPSWRLSLGLAVLLIFSCLIRTMGVVLFPSVIAAAYMIKANKEQWKKIAAMLILGILVLGGWALRNHLVDQDISLREDTYIEQLMWKDPFNKDEGRMTIAAIPQRIAANLVHYARASEALFLNKGRIVSGGVPTVGLLILMIVLASTLYRLRKHGEIQDFFVLIYLILLLLWPSQAGARFLLPVFILVLISLWETLRGMFRWLVAPWPVSISSKKAIQSVLTALVVALCLALSAKGIIQIHASRNMKGSVVAHTKPLVAVGEWLRTEPPTAPIVLCNFPSIVHRLTGASIVGGEYTSFFVCNLERIKEGEVTHLIIRESHKAEYGENLLSNGGFELTDSEGNLKNWINCQGARIDREVFYEGQVSLSAEVSGGETVNWYFPSQTVSVKPGRLYRLSGFVKGKGVQGAMMIEVQHARSYKQGLWRTSTLSGTFDWQPLELVFTTPPGTEKIKIYPIRVPRFKKGQVWVDQVRLEEVVYQCGGMVSSF